MLKTPLWKKIIVVLSLALLMLCVVAIGSVKGDETDMYVEIFDINNNHISNVTIEKWTITRRVFDFDTSSFEGVCNDDISNGQYFIFKTAEGTKKYSGFIKNITQDENGFVKFKGDDLRRVFDTDIRLDFSQETYINQAENKFALDNMFGYVFDAVESEVVGMSLVDTIPNDDRLTQFIANYSGNVFTQNAWQFLKVYLAYYNYYVVAEYDAGGFTTIEFVHNEDTVEMMLSDFVFDKTSTDTKTNHTIAIIKPVDNRLSAKVWMYSSQELFDATPAALQYTYEISVLNQAEADAYSPVAFEDSFQDRELDMNIKVNLWDGTPYEDNLLRTFYMQPVMNYSAIETDIIEIHYYLGKDNNIYISTISTSLVILPTVTKIFDEEYLSAAQYKAVWELVNSRYIEYIILTDIENIPIDIKTLTLYEMVTVYDSEGSSKIVPVSEIEWTQDGYKVKLGFKKILLTEIIKG